jgi:Domain of unknown function (DUF5615)
MSGRGSRTVLSAPSITLTCASASMPGESDLRNQRMGATLRQKPLLNDASLDDERPRFLADEGFNRDVTDGLRRRHRQVDLVTVQEAGLLHLSDHQLLVVTQQLNRILLSHDVHTMPGHFYTLLAQLPPKEHLPGVLLVAQQAPIGKAIEWIAEVWGASRQDEWRDQVGGLPL